MRTFVIGDVHGCLNDLLAILEEINFTVGVDKLISVGDIINRGPNSLETIRFFKQLGSSFDMVLGNHDLHFLAIVHGAKNPTFKDTLTQLLNAKDLDDLVGWLQAKPLITQIKNYSIVHAGIAPQWNITKALSLSREVEMTLNSENSGHFLNQMYGNVPNSWNENLKGMTRLRVITNYFTRMRLCSNNGELNFTDSDPNLKSHRFLPWFKHRIKHKNEKIIFGHWASLNGKFCAPNIHALDVGCVWGGKIRVMNIDNEVITDYKSAYAQH
ncbi:symmetrical bis(5'-nucleosyl)-tetraphosphatase [Gammaproteobacteria bacterium]|nr:symmetrical bis(5'-nucleosyl)-tetraphosphatase [Gammaproteobacteria bacterium]